MLHVSTESHSWQRGPQSTHISPATVYLLAHARQSVYPSWKPSGHVSHLSALVQVAHDYPHGVHAPVSRSIKKPSLQEHYPSCKKAFISQTVHSEGRLHSRQPAEHGTHVSPTIVAPCPHSRQIESPKLKPSAQVWHFKPSSEHV